MIYPIQKLISVSAQNRKTSRKKLAKQLKNIAHTNPNDELIRVVAVHLSSLEHYLDHDNIHDNENQRKENSSPANRRGISNRDGRGFCVPEHFQLLGGGGNCLRRWSFD